MNTFPLIELYAVIHGGLLDLEYKNTRGSEADLSSIYLSIVTALL